MPVWLPNEMFDLNGDEQVSDDDYRVWVKDLLHTWFGDANLDGEFNTADLTAVLEIGEYEDAVPENSTWSEGDWSGDFEFDTRDVVLALQNGGYERGPRSAVIAVPEPATWLLISTALLGLGCRPSRRWTKRLSG